MNSFLMGVILIFAVGLYGLLVTRNLFKVIIALQLLVKSAVLALVLAGSAGGQLQLGQSLAATVLVADTMVAVVGLALAIQVKRRVGTVDVRQLGKLRG